MFNVNFMLRSLVAFLLLASPAFAASVSVVPTGNPASFSVVGSGMDGVSGIQLDITYDSASLATPTVTQGALVSGAMLAANTTNPGSIKIAIISTNSFSGSGTIATITFASRTGSGGITSVNSSMINNTGAALPSSASIQSSDSTSTTPNPSPTASTSTASTTTTLTSQPNQTGQATQGASTTPTTYLGTISLPTDQQQRTDSQPVNPSTAPAYTGEQSAKTAEQAPPSNKSAPDSKIAETPQFVVYKSISDRFKHYSGKKTLSAMVKLFDKKISQAIHQDPPILLSDGKSKATITVNIPARITTSPNFAVNGGTLVSYKQETQIKGRWTVVILPNAGSNNVSVTVIAGAEEFEYPLTVAQPIKTALTLDETGWITFSKELGTVSKPLHDLNNDGIRNYLDEYIFVANYLAMKKTTASKPPLTKNKTSR